jgi:hypothetical protein
MNPRDDYAVTRPMPLICHDTHRTAFCLSSPPVLRMLPQPFQAIFLSQRMTVTLGQMPQLAL